MRLLPIALLSCALPAFAQSHDPFPPDYTPSPCAVEDSCKTFPRSNMPSAALQELGFRLDAFWVDQHFDAVVNAMAPACRRHATCLGTAGNIFWFCNETLGIEVRPICDKLFPRNVSPTDWNECTWLRDTILMGIEGVKGAWQAKQECAKAAAKPHTKPLDFWMVPAKLPVGFSGDLMFYALDPDTHVPVLARIEFEGQQVWSPANPAGNPITFHAVPYTLKFNRIPNADGHTDVVPPTITVISPAYPAAVPGPAYPDLKLRLPVDVPKVIVEMNPPAAKLRRGKNSVIIAARDADSGKPVEMQIMLGEDAIGQTNKPVTIEIAKGGHHPEIWLTSVFNRYSDVVVAKAR